jgi:ribonuclease P protein component
MPERLSIRLPKFDTLVTRSLYCGSSFSPNMRVKSGRAEANVATEKTTPSTSSWIQDAHPHAGRAKRHEPTSVQRPTSAHRLSTSSAGEAHGPNPSTREKRLTHRSDFESLRRDGAYRTHPLVALRAARNGLPYSRFGFIVGRRVNKKATARNLIRRRMREIAHGAPIAQGWDLLFIGRSQVNGASFSDLREAMVDLGRRAKALIPGQINLIKGI